MCGMVDCLEGEVTQDLGTSQGDLDETTIDFVSLNSSKAPLFLLKVFLAMSA